MKVTLTVAVIAAAMVLAGCGETAINKESVSSKPDETYLSITNPVSGEITTIAINVSSNANSIVNVILGDGTASLVPAAPEVAEP
jgi:PBP1b-binding outer membrane lipoprotein LpoB